MFKRGALMADLENKVHPELIKKVQEQMLVDEEFNKLGNLYYVFSDPVRIKIIFLLVISEMCVYDISTLINATQSNVSHHLAILKSNDLVSFYKKGKQVIYFLKDDHVKRIFQLGLEHIREK